jgi:oligoendopeptidase F
MFRNDPVGFRDRYIALMRNGFDDTPEHLLKTSLNIDLEDPALLRSALAILEQRLDELRKLYQQNERGKP